MSKWATMTAGIAIVDQSFGLLASATAESMKAGLLPV